ncbi:MAG: hypothetical protein WA918_07475 [Erythrobacter sp.]
MPGFTFGFGFRGTESGAISGGPPLPAPSALAPHSDWDGTAGSGFAMVPSDPVRQTAKPVLRLLTPPKQWYTERQLVGVAAAANDGGSLMANLGIERVVAHFEGNTRDILFPSHRAITDANGHRRTYLGWWVELENDGRHGFGDLYFEAVPHDATMQRRVIGPYRYAPQALQHTHQIEINEDLTEVAGRRYRNGNNAMNYLRTQPAPINPLITLTKAPSDGNFRGWRFGYNFANHAEGYVHLTASVPVTFTKSEEPADGTRFASFTHWCNGMHIFGENITFDFREMEELSHAGNAWPGGGFWLDGIRLVDSNGRYDLVEKRPRDRLGFLVRGLGDANRPWLTEITCDSLWNVGTSANLVRGGTFANCWADLFRDAGCVVGTEAFNARNSQFRNLLPAMSVTYTGSEPTASININGLNGASSRTVVARWGSNTATFSLYGDSGSFAAGTNYNVSNIVDWINTELAAQDPGWSATLLDDTRRAINIARQGNDLVSDFPQTDVKDRTVTLGTAFDIHGDWCQQQETGVAWENVYLEGNLGYEMDLQVVLIGNRGGSRDVVCFNNAWAITQDALASGTATQFAPDQSHLVYVHNTLLNQRVLLRTANRPSAFDGYSLIANNALGNIEWTDAPVADMTIADNHLQSIGQAPQNAEGTSTGGTQDDLAVDAINGDFTPAGALLSTLRPPRVPFDRTGAIRPARAPAGALA